MSCDVGEVNELCSFSKFLVTSPTLQLILQPFCCLIYVTAYSPTLSSLHLRHNSIVASSTLQLILQIFSCFTYITAHSPTFPLPHLCHSSLYNSSVASPTSQLNFHPSVALPTSQLILQPFCCFTYITVHSPTLLLLILCHRFSLTSLGEPPMDSSLDY